MLIPLEAVLDKDEVRQFRLQLDQASWQDGALSAGSLARQVKRNLQLDEHSELAIELGNRILRKLGRHPAFLSAALPRRIYPPRFNRYRDGGTYGAHIDSAILQLPGSGLNVRSDVSATLFLSEPEDYEGGVLEIESNTGLQRIKLPAGSMILYPSSTLHRVTPVLRGERVAAFFWIESLVADEHARTLLFDLDQSIQALTPRLPAGDTQLVKLSGVYHNLLRRWAIT